MQLEITMGSMQLRSKLHSLYIYVDDEEENTNYFFLKLKQASEDRWSTITD